MLESKATDSESIVDAEVANDSHIDDIKSGVRYAKSTVTRNAVYRFRYNIYVEGAGKESNSANHALRMLVDPVDSESTILFTSNDSGEITGTISIVFGPFPDYLNQRLQIDDIAESLTGILPSRCAYVSRLIVDGCRGSFRETASQLINEAFMTCVKEGALLGFAHGARPMQRYFSRWGFLHYGRPFIEDYPREQHLLISAPANREILQDQMSPLLDTIPHSHSHSGSAAVKAFAKITGWSTRYEL